MSDLFDDPDQSGGDNAVPRDKWGRPLIEPPGGGKRVAYRRVTRFIGVLEDTYNLSRWSQRNVAYGMARREDLILAAASVELDAKKKLDEIVDRACETANSKGGATKGTALHTFTEKLDRGEPLGHIPAQFRPDVDAYEAATKHLNYAALEQFRVHDGYRIAGTADRIIEWDDSYMIGDLKTGSVDWSWVKHSMQLAAYAAGVAYDRGERHPDAKPMNLKTGLLIHLPVGTGTCTIYEVDLEIGAAALEVAKSVWHYRDMKADAIRKLAEPGMPQAFPFMDTPAKVETVAREIRQRQSASDILVEKVYTFTDIAEMRQWYAALDARGRATPEVLRACKIHAQKLEGK